MSRRPSLPGAAELFRSTGPSEEPASPPAPAEAPPAPGAEAATPAAPEAGAPARRTTRSSARDRVDRRPTGRERHDEKITVYCSAEELIDLEHARLTLRRDFGLAVDRGRIVREAMAVVLADLEAKGDASILVRRLTGR